LSPGRGQTASEPYKDGQVIQNEMDKCSLEQPQVISIDVKLEEIVLANQIVEKESPDRLETTANASSESEMKPDANFDQSHPPVDSPRPGVDSNQEYMPANQIEKKGVRPSLINRDERTYLAELPVFGERNIENSASELNLKKIYLVFDQEKCSAAGVSISDYLRNAISCIVTERSNAPRPSSVFADDTSSDSDKSCSDSEDVVEDVADKILEGGNVRKNKRKRENFLDSRQRKKEKNSEEIADFRPNSSNLETYCSQKEINSDNEDCVMMVDGSLVLPHRNLKDDLLELLHEK
jgi:hypothetical protein